MIFKQFSKYIKILKTEFNKIHWINLNKSLEIKPIVGIIGTSMIIYTTFYSLLGNSIYRTNSTNVKQLQILSLFTEGFIGPIRSFFYLLYYEGMYPALIYSYHEVFRLSNPYSAFIFVLYFNKIIRYNLF